MWLRIPYIPPKWRTSFLVTVEASLTRPIAIEALGPTFRSVRRTTLKGDLTFSWSEEAGLYRNGSLESWSPETWLIEWLLSLDELMVARKEKGMIETRQGEEIHWKARVIENNPTQETLRKNQGRIGRDKGQRRRTYLLREGTLEGEPGSKLFMFSLRLGNKATLATAMQSP